MASNPVGRPLIFKSPEDLEQKIEEYFTYCDNRIRHVFDKKSGSVIEVIDPEPYTMSGLAYALGIDRDTLLNYSKKEEFFGTLKKAKDKVHSDVERRLMESNPTGAIFNLKNNFGWKDRTEVEATVTDSRKEILKQYELGIIDAGETTETSSESSEDTA